MTSQRCLAQLQCSVCMHHMTCESKHLMHSRLCLKGALGQSLHLLLFGLQYDHQYMAHQPCMCISAVLHILLTADAVHLNHSFLMLGLADLVHGMSRKSHCGCAGWQHELMSDIDLGEMLA